MATVPIRTRAATPMTRSAAIELLRRTGMANPLRVAQLIHQAIAFLELDLSGLVVLTEAASGPYVVTPIVAALAGAERVLALTRDSQYATADAVMSQTTALATLCEVTGPIHVHTERSSDLFADADIITNSGFVRPIDAAVVQAMRPTAVVSLMYETWEFRPQDVDLSACIARDIPVLGVNEDYPGLQVFEYSGALCIKLLLDAQIELHKTHVLVVGDDKFGKVIARALSQASTSVLMVPELRTEQSRKALCGIDAVVIADYVRSSSVIGPDGDISATDFAGLAENATIIQFAGRNDLAGLLERGVTVYPAMQLDVHRMAVTLAGLGARPVVELHAAGLKVGELAARSRLAGKELPTEEWLHFRRHPLAHHVVLDL